MYFEIARPIREQHQRHALQLAPTTTAESSIRLGALTHRAALRDDLNIRDLKIKRFLD